MGFVYCPGPQPAKPRLILFQNWHCLYGHHVAEVDARVVLDLLPAVVVLVLAGVVAELEFVLAQLTQL